MNLRYLVRTSPARHVLATALAAVLATTALTVLPPSPAAPAAPAPTSAIMELPIPPVYSTLSSTTARSSASSVTLAALPPRDTPSFSMAAVTWTGDVTPTVRVRTKSGSTWSPWVTFERDDYRGTGTSGTEPLFLGSHRTGIEVRVTGEKGMSAKDLKVTLIDTDALAAGDVPVAASKAGTHEPPAETPAMTRVSPLASRSATNATSYGAVARHPNRPANIVTRAQWGANESLVKSGDCKGEMPTIQGAIVHHTAGSNDYRPNQAPGILRGILAYHTQSRGWCDIGYNILIDKYGTVYEGRRGSLDRPMEGVHAGPGNYRSVGISLMVNSETYAPSDEVYRKLAEVIAWRLGTYATAPGGTARYFVKGRWITIGAVAGHREVMSTECPGKYIWDNLPRVRAWADSMVTVYTMSMNGLPSHPGVDTGLTVSGTVSPSLAGSRLTVTVRSGSTHLGSATTTVAHDGSWSLYTKAGTGVEGVHTVTASLAPSGTALLTTTQTITRSNQKVVLNSFPGVQPGGKTIHLTGKIVPATSGTVTILGDAGTSIPTTVLGTTKASSDGSFSYALRLGASAPGTYRVMARTDLDGIRLESGALTFSRQNVVALMLPATNASVAGPIPVSGRYSPAEAGATIRIDAQVGDGPVIEGVGTAIGQADGSWATTLNDPRLFGSLVKLRAAASRGWTTIGGWRPIDRRASVTWSTIPGPVYGNSPITFTGRATPATGGREVWVVAYGPTGQNLGRVATGTTRSDGSFTMSTTWRNDVGGVYRYQVGAAFPEDGKIRTNTST